MKEKGEMGLTQKPGGDEKIKKVRLGRLEIRFRA
jgi:hypothetical protein